MKALSDQKLVTAIFTNEREGLATQAMTILPSIKVLYGYNFCEGTAYCRPLRGGDGFKIMICGQAMKSTLKIPSRIYSKDDTKKFIPGLRIMFRAFNYHEIGHLKFTDMKDTRILTYKVPEHRNFIHQIFNITEDVVMEKYGMSYTYPKTAKYFKWLTKNMFLPQNKDYKDDPDNPNAFLNFLLLKLRLGKDFTGKSVIWENNKKKLAPMVMAILSEEDATERITKNILLAEYLIKINPKWDFSCVEEPVDSPVGKGGSGTGTTPAKAKGKKGKKPAPTKTTKAGDDGEGGGLPGDSEGESNPENGGSHNNRGSDHVTDPEEKEFKKADELEDGDEDDDIEDRYDDKNDLLLDECDEVDDSFNDTLGEGRDNHRFILAKDYYISTPSVEQAINERLDSVATLATSVKQALDVYKGRIRPKYNRGFNSGKLDIRKAMANSLTHGCDTKLFQRKIANGIAPDLAISILCDNSGSMGGNKSRVCTTAMLALARACQLTNIPIEINCFSERGAMNYTIQMKELKDSFDDSKCFLGLTDSDIYGSYMDDDDLKYIQFCGNEDEVNLYYVWKQFRRCKHKDKLIIVISDGETCGSSDRLRNLVQEIEKDKISIIGLGIQSHAVASLYTNYKLFDTKESLDGLPEFLTTTLFKFAKGGK